MSPNHDPLVDGRSHALPPSVLKADAAAEMDHRLGATASPLVNAIHPPGDRPARIQVGEVGRHQRRKALPDPPRALIGSPSPPVEEGFDLLAHQITGLRSTIGVPFSASMFVTLILNPSTSTTSTGCSPIGLGRSGERVAKTP